ncbi:MAG: Ig-like domain-containing protein [candidate division KSB1 bacterium]|nr:Ig-like domain-containing protein [candidate division KSB1 bacterium]
MRRFCLILIMMPAVIAGLHCASQGYPGGGPVDETPPVVLSTVPAADSIGVSAQTDVIIRFSEPVQPNSCEPLVFITPFVSRDRLQFDWKKDRELTLRFKDPLMPDKTYVITIGAGTRDRRSNSMRYSFTLAFSTGESIDRGQLTGQVYSDQPVKGTKVWAYSLNDSLNPDPARQSPLYITQVGEDGGFSLNYMAPGRYRLFAVLDRDLNNLYNAGFDKLGVAPADVYTDSSETPWIGIRTAMRDTMPPVIARAEAPDAIHLNVRFSKAMLTHPDSLFLQPPTRNGDTLAVYDAYWDSRNNAVLRLVTGTQRPGPYRMRISKAYDTFYNPLPPDSATLEFDGAAQPDTAAASVIARFPNDTTRLQPPDTPIEMTFSEAMDQWSVQQAFSLVDTLGADTIGGRFEWPNLARMRFVPDSLAPHTHYRFCLDVTAVTDRAGNALSDTLVQQDFETWNPDTLSQIAGTVIDPDTAAQGPVFLYARKRNADKPHRIILPTDGPFRFRGLLPGDYLLQGFRDADENGRYSYGQALPWQPAEVFFVYSDTVSIRSRWPNEGNDIIIPR